MDTPLTNDTTSQFIREHREDDIRRLALRSDRCPGVDMPYALDQIAGWQTARRKLPAWAGTEGIVFPPRLSMEQCSSEATARYKQALVRRLLDAEPSAAADRTSVTDLTGGFGVDFSFLAPLFGEATYVERDGRLCRVAESNLRALGIAHARIVCAQAEDVLSALPRQTLLFADPARRDDRGGRTVAIADCTPDVAALLPLIARCAPLALIKLSPMLDWHKAVADLQGTVAEVHIVAVRGECKELLLLLRTEDCGTPPVPTLYCADLRDGHMLTFSCRADEVQTSAPVAPADALQPGTWLYEPGAPVMKAGAFGVLARRFGLSAVAVNSHLFLGGERCDRFPGRVFRIDRVTTLAKRELREALRGITAANVAVRNFPLTAEALRRKLRLADGGDRYLFATTTAAGAHVVIIAHKE